MSVAPDFNDNGEVNFSPASNNSESEIENTNNNLQIYRKIDKIKKWVL